MIPLPLRRLMRSNSTRICALLFLTCGLSTLLFSVGGTTRTVECLREDGGADAFTCTVVERGPLVRGGLSEEHFDPVSAVVPDILRLENARGTSTQWTLAVASRARGGPSPDTDRSDQLALTLSLIHI